MTTPRNHETVAVQAREWRYKVQTETLGAPTTEHDFGFWDDERVAAFVESNSHLNLLAQALGCVYCNNANSWNPATNGKHAYKFGPEERFCDARAIRSIG